MKYFEGAQVLGAMPVYQVPSDPTAATRTAAARKRLAAINQQLESNRGAQMTASMALSQQLLQTAVPADQTSASQPDAHPAEQAAPADASTTPTDYVSGAYVLGMDMVGMAAHPVAVVKSAPVGKAPILPTVVKTGGPIKPVVKTPSTPVKASTSGVKAASETGTAPTLPGGKTKGAPLPSTPEQQKAVAALKNTVAATTAAAAAAKNQNKAVAASARATATRLKVSSAKLAKRSPRLSQSLTTLANTLNASATALDAASAKATTAAPVTTTKKVVNKGAVMGVVLGDDTTTAGTVTQTVNDAMRAAQVGDIAAQIAGALDALQAAGQTMLVKSGQEIIDRCAAVVDQVHASIQQAHRAM